MMHPGHILPPGRARIVPAMRGRALSAALLGLLASPLGAEDGIRWDIEPEQLIRRVASAQKAVDDGLSNYTFDQKIVETKYDAKGRTKETTSKLFYVYSGEKAREVSRELIEVDGRPATEKEKREALEEDAKRDKKRIEDQAAERAKNPPKVSGDDDEPLVGGRRLSDVMDRFQYRYVGEEVREGRVVYVMDFAPRPGAPAKSAAEKAFNQLAGRAVVDASDFQIRAIDAYLTKPVKVAGGLAANVKEAFISYEARPARDALWFPCTIDLRVKGKAALLFRLDAQYRFELTNFRTFGVETETEGSRPIGEIPVEENPGGTAP